MMSERAQRDVDIQNQVRLETFTFKTKTISKHCSKTSSIGANLKAKMWSAVPHHKVITNSLFIPPACGTGLSPALGAQCTLPLSRALLSPRGPALFPIILCQNIDAPSCTSAHSKPCCTLSLVVAVPGHSQMLFAVATSLLETIPLVLRRFGFNAGGAWVWCPSPRRSPAPGPWLCLELTQQWTPPQVFWPSMNSWSELNIPSESAVQLLALGMDVTGQEKKREGSALWETSGSAKLRERRHQKRTKPAPAKGPGIPVWISTCS